MITKGGGCFGIDKLRRVRFEICRIRKFITRLAEWEVLSDTGKYERANLKFVKNERSILITAKAEAGFKLAR